MWLCTHQWHRSWTCAPILISNSNWEERRKRMCASFNLNEVVVLLLCNRIHFLSVAYSFCITLLLKFSSSDHLSKKQHRENRRMRGWWMCDIDGNDMILLFDLHDFKLISNQITTKTTRETQCERNGSPSFCNSEVKIRRISWYRFNYMPCQRRVFVCTGVCMCIKSYLEALSR